jgi:hypothetical protein
LFAQDAETPSLVNVVSKAYRRVALFEPGEYEAVRSYNGTTEPVYGYSDIQMFQFGYVIDSRQRTEKKSSRMS